MSSAHTFAVFGTEPSAVEEALSEVCAVAGPVDRVRTCLALASWPRSPGLRDAYRWDCADRLRDLLAARGRADDCVVLAGGTPSRALRAMVNAARHTDVLVLADGWEYLLVEALGLGPDVWLWPAGTTTCSSLADAAMPRWFSPRTTGSGIGVPTEVAPAAEPMEQLRWVHARRGRPVILPGAGPRVASGWLDWLVQRRAG